MVVSSPLDIGWFDGKSPRNGKGATSLTGLVKPNFERVLQELRVEYGALLGVIGKSSEPSIHWKKKNALKHLVECVVIDQS